MSLLRNLQQQGVLRPLDSALAQSLHLCDKSLLQHGIKALRNARMQPLAVARLQ